jgi:hypothetical protein
LGILLSPIHLFAEYNLSFTMDGIGAVVLMFSAAMAQQLSGAQMFVSYQWLSASCIDALNTTVSCPIFLGPLSLSNGILDSSSVTELCVDSCYTSLQSARVTILDSCTESTDIVVYDNISYPGMFSCSSFFDGY